MNIDSTTFIHELSFKDLPPAVVVQALRCLHDLTKLFVFKRVDLDRCWFTRPGGLRYAT